MLNALKVKVKSVRAYKHSNTVLYCNTLDEIAQSGTRRRSHSF